MLFGCVQVFTFFLLLFAPSPTTYFLSTWLVEPEKHTLEKPHFPDMMEIKQQYRLWSVGTKITYSKFFLLPQMHL